jgi:hypothetical protein
MNKQQKEEKKEKRKKKNSHILWAVWWTSELVASRDLIHSVSRVPPTVRGVAPGENLPNLSKAKVVKAVKAVNVGGQSASQPVSQSVRHAVSQSVSRSFSPCAGCTRSKICIVEVKAQYHPT